MREVIVESVGKGTRTIQVGIDWSKIESTPKTELPSFGIICSPRVLPRTGSNSKPHKSRSWKTTKKGKSHARKNYQRHGERKPSRRRARWGHFRGYIYPSVRILNEMDRCIYPYVSVEEMEYWENLSEDHVKWLLGED